MTYTTRKAAHKQINAAYGNLETALAHLLKVKEDYQVDHPEISEAVEAVMVNLLQCQELIARLKRSF